MFTVFETAVMTNGSFVIERSRPLSLEISGEAAQLYKGVTGFTPSSAILNKSYTIPVIDISIDNDTLTDVVGVTMELQNDIEWTPYTTVNKAVFATTMYPSGFKISKKYSQGQLLNI